MSTKRGLPDDDDPLGSVLGPADTNEKAAPKHEADDEKPRKPGAVRRVVKRAKVAASEGGSGSKRPAPAKESTPANEADETQDDEPERRKRITFTLPESLAEKLRDAGWHYRRPLAHLVEHAILDHLDALEREHGPVPERPTEAELQRGRPIGPRRA
jgi:hypothetical protein